MAGGGSTTSGPTGTVPALTRADRDSLAATLLHWYDRCARDLPWREPGIGGWPVLVSEIMLQQTPVARVLPAYEAWLDRWPTPGTLAADSPGEAVRMWGRLGYPRRALRLHECAAAVVARHGGTVPSSVEELARLPGIGHYTARAVAAFAYGQRHPVVDTNVRRVLARLVTGQADLGSARPSRDDALMEPLLPAEPGRAARFSVAVMELGALRCVAGRPRCHDCPVAGTCAWRRAGYPPSAGPTRRPQRYAGTDRQVRGRLLAVLRDSEDAVARADLDRAWAEPVQRDRALAALIADGLVTALPDGRFALPSR